MIPNKIISLIDRYYLLLMAIVSSTIMLMNLSATDMSGLIPQYQKFKNIILAGFNVPVDQKITFPMWGYGWLLLISEKMLVLLLVQNALALLAVWVFLRYVVIHQLLSARHVRVFKISLLLCHSLVCLSLTPVALQPSGEFHYH